MRKRGRKECICEERAGPIDVEHVRGRKRSHVRTKLQQRAIMCKYVSCKKVRNLWRVPSLPRRVQQSNIEQQKKM